MKIVYFLLLLPLILSCGVNNSGPQGNQPGPVSCGGTSSIVPDGVYLSCMNPTVMKFKVHNGHEYISLGDVTAVDISVLATPDGHVAGMARNFTSSDAIKVVSRLGLYSPSEGASPASMTTGIIVIHYKRKSDSDDHIKTLTIQNSRLLADKTFADVTYNPSRKLDSEWLAKLPDIE